MTNLGKDHYDTTTSDLKPQDLEWQLRVEQLEQRLIKLEDQCADLASKLAALETLLVADSDHNNFGC